MSKMDTISALSDVSRKNAVRVLHVLHPDTKDPLYLDEGDGKTQPLEIQYVGVESDDFVQANHDSRKIRYQREVDGKEFDPAVEDDAAVRQLVYCTKGWSNIPESFIKDGGSRNSVPFSREFATELYTRHGWLRRQVFEAVWKREPFVKAS